MTANIDVPTTDIIYLTTASSIKVRTNNFDNDRYSEMELQPLWRQYRNLNC